MPVREAGRLTVDLHFSFLSSKLNPQVSPPVLQQTTCYGFTSFSALFPSRPSIVASLHSLSQSPEDQEDPIVKSCFPPSFSYHSLCLISFPKSLFIKCRNTLYLNSTDAIHGRVEKQFLSRQATTTTFFLESVRVIKSKEQNIYLTQTRSAPRHTIF